MFKSVLKPASNYLIYLWYHLLIIKAWYQGEPLDFMNLGYLELDNDQFSEDAINKKEKLNRQSNLYQKLFEGLDSKVRNVLEVGSGLGGGIELARNKLCHRNCIGVDKLALSVRYSNAKFKKSEAGIEFRKATSENFPNVLNSEKFDLIFSLEASQHFPENTLFFKNVYKVLSHQGRFHYADVFLKASVVSIEDSIIKSGLVILAKEDITNGVLTSIEHSSTSGGIMGFLENILLNQQGINFTKNSDFHLKLKKGELIYLKYVIKKYDSY